MLGNAPSSLPPSETSNAFLKPTMLENASKFRAEEVVQINAERFIQHDARRYQGTHAARGSTVFQLRADSVFSGKAEGSSTVQINALTYNHHDNRSPSSLARED